MASVRPLDVNVGDVIVREGEQGDRLHLVETGSLATTVAPDLEASFGRSTPGGDSEAADTAADASDTPTPAASPSREHHATSGRPTPSPTSADRPPSRVSLASTHRRGNDSTRSLNSDAPSAAAAGGGGGGGGGVHSHDSDSTGVSEGNTSSMASSMVRVSGRRGSAKSVPSFSAMHRHGSSSSHRRSDSRSRPKTYRPGSWFGEGVLLHAAPYRATVRCVAGPCRLWTLKRTRFRRCIAAAARARLEQVWTLPSHLCCCRWVCNSW